MFRSSCAALLAILLASPALAQEVAGAGAGVSAATNPATSSASSADGKPWLLVLAALTDENSYDNALASFHIGLGSATWLSATAGASRAPSTEADVRADLLAIGVEHDFGPIGVGLTAERWGDDGDLETEDWMGEVFYRNDRLRVGLLLERRDVEVYFAGSAPPVLASRQAGIDADAIGVGGRIRLTPRWRLYGSWMDYDYSPRLRLIPVADRLNLLGPSALTLALSFVDEYSRVGIERAFGLKLVNFDFGSDRSAIDDSRLKSVSGAVLWPVSARMDLELRVGSSRVDAYESSFYGGLTLLIYGGG